MVLFWPLTLALSPEGVDEIRKLFAGERGQISPSSLKTKSSPLDPKS